MEKDTKHIISFGCGVQTVALVLLNIHRDDRLKKVIGVDFAECAIFADTQWEKSATYEYFKWFRTFCNRHNFKIHLVSAGDLRTDALNNKDRFASMPLFTARNDGEVGMLRRQCTREYKVAPVDKKIRELCHIKPKHRMTAKINLWFGITIDEIERMKDAREKWKTKVYPFVEMRWTRADCKNYLISHGIPVPPKSSCIGCPFHDNYQWLDLKHNSNGDWNDAVDFDRRIRNLTKKGVKQPAYLHRQVVPLDEANLNENQCDLFRSECEGMCGI